MNIQRFAAPLIIAIATIMLYSCGTYLVGLHNTETAKNHFVIVTSMGTVYDCYSAPDGKWKPVCKEVERENRPTWGSNSSN